MCGLCDASCARCGCRSFKKHDVGQQLLGLRQSTAEVLQGSIELSQRIEEPAANVEQTVASMEQLQSTVKKNSEGAQASARTPTVRATWSVRAGPPSARLS